MGMTTAKTRKEVNKQNGEEQKEKRKRKRQKVLQLKGALLILWLPVCFVKKWITILLVWHKANATCQEN